MQINVVQQLKSDIGSTREYEIDENIDLCGNGSTLPVRGKVTLTRTDSGILVKGVVDTEVELACSRCLSSFKCPLVLNIEEEYLPTTDVTSGTPLPPPDDPDRFVIDECHILDLTEVLRQNALLAIPMKPLCQENCAGLCPNCGHNLNQGPCSCPS